MTNIGYARVSTTDQNLEIQIAALKAAGCDVIRYEKRSGTSTKGRTELETVLDFLRKGDALVVTRIDRLARSIGDLQDIVRAVKAKGATLRATEQPFDTGNIYGNSQSIYLAASPSSRQTFAGKGRPRASQKQKLLASTRVGVRRSISPKSKI